MKTSRQQLCRLGLGGFLLTAITALPAVLFASAGWHEEANRLGLYRGRFDKHESFLVYCVEDAKGELVRVVFPGEEGLLEDKRLDDAIKARRHVEWTGYIATGGGYPLPCVGFAFNALAEIGGSSASPGKPRFRFERLAGLRVLWWGALADFLLFGMSLWVVQKIYIYVRQRRMRAGSASGEPFCGRCGYSLRGLTSGRCPECGSPADPYSSAATDSPGSTRAPAARGRRV